tara:strand:- start:2535 stop:2756 length:222 start_codon:yes stop_codon:yes gene_type:complete
MTKQYQIQEYINKNVVKTLYVDGVKQDKAVWSAFDPREGDDFYCETYQEAVSIFVSNWDNLTEQERNNLVSIY